jgi:hypothetical protein
MNRRSPLDRPPCWNTTPIPSGGFGPTCATGFRIPPPSANDDDPEQPSLLLLAPPALHITAPAVHSYAEFYYRQTKRFLLIRGDVTLPVDHSQLRFSFMENSTPNNIVQYVSQPRQMYLDYGVYDTFRDEPGLVNPSRKLERQGIRLIGNLVQMSREELATFSFLDADTLDQMEAQLALAGLRFGMNIPWWGRPQYPRKGVVAPINQTGIVIRLGTRSEDAVDR